MIHSFIQQVIRQNPAYYLTYVCYRPDHSTHLISYPYYTKYALRGDSTRFKHIDLNVPPLLAGRGSSQIQGSLSFDPGDSENSTIVLPGLHDPTTLSTWHTDLKNRLPPKHSKKLPTSPRLSMDESWYWWTSGDINKHGTDWTTQPCPPGTVRLTQPHLPHGSTPHCTKTRRTVLPWFVGIRADHETLDVRESGTCSSVAAAHRDLSLCARGPSGLANTLAKIPFPFPLASKLSSLSAVSDALVGARRWTEPAVKLELAMLFSEDVRVRDKYLEHWERRAKEVLFEAYRVLRELEPCVYKGPRSFFENLGKEPPLPDFDPADVLEGGDDGEDEEGERPIVEEGVVKEIGAKVDPMLGSDEVDRARLPEVNRMNSDEEQEDEHNPSAKRQKLNAD